MIRAVRLAAALLGLAPVLGCGGPLRAPGPPGETLILLENRVSGTCQLTWANAHVDDRALSLVTITPPGSRPAPLDRPVLAPGQHTVSIAATASCEGAGGADHPIVLQVTQPVYMGREGGKITVSLGVNTEKGLEAKFAVVGGHVLAPRADGKDVDCRERMPMDWAICRTEASLARAHERRDVALVLCISEKLREMRDIAGTMSHPMREPGAEHAALRDVSADAAQRVVQLATDAEYCIGGENITDGGGSRMNRATSRGAPAFQ